MQGFLSLMPFTYGIDESVSNFNLACKQDWKILYLYELYVIID